MKRFVALLGVVIFWAGTPVWFVYFRLSSKRSRVLVVADKKVLMVKGFLNRSSEWSLPGGGIKRDESPLTGALRELQEETAITAKENQLKDFGEYQNRSFIAPYTAVYFLLELDETPRLSLQRHEILEARWLSIEEALRLKTDVDARFALEQYRTRRA